MGFRKPWTEASILRVQRQLWVVTALVFVVAIIDLLERDWAWAAALFAIGVLSVFRNRRIVRTLRERVRPPRDS